MNLEELREQLKNPGRRPTPPECDLARGQWLDVTNLVSRRTELAARAQEMAFEMGWPQRTTAVVWEGRNVIAYVDAPMGEGVKARSEQVLRTTSGKTLLWVPKYGHFDKPNVPPTL